MADMFDLVVIGAGMADVNAANRCASAGWTPSPATTGSRPSSTQSPNSPVSGCWKPTPSRRVSIVEVRYRDTSGWFSNYRIGETAAATKILIDRSTDTIVGAHMVGPEDGELINFCALAIKLGLTTSQFKSMTASYPSVGSDLGSMI